MRIAIRVDASLRIGSGHVMRCAALAGFLRRQNADVAFVCRAQEGDYCDWLEARGYTVFRLPATAANEAKDRRLAHSQWLGVTQARDGEETRRCLSDGKWDWLIVDHYGLDAEWETQMRPLVGRIMAIDDLADRRHDADVLLDQNIQSRPGRYRDCVPDTCTQLLGPSYVLLRPEFAQLRGQTQPRSGELNRLLVFMGGSDPLNLTSRALEGVCSSGLALHVDVVMGGVSVHLDDVRQQCAAMPDCSLHVQTEDMAGLMAASDLMIGAPGSATWERCCLGLPSLLMAFAENQRELGIQVARHRAAILLGQAEDVSAMDIADILQRLAKRPGLLREMSGRAGRIVDGDGAKRVAAALLGNLEIAIVSDAESWINDRLQYLISDWRAAGHRVRCVYHVQETPAGDLAFFLSCSEIASRDVLRRNANNLVVHESALPAGRGWSPLTWQILEGKNRIPITLFEAAEAVDSGVIYLRHEMEFSGDELIDELRNTQAAATIKLCQEFVDNYPAIAARGEPQRGSATYYPRRRPADSRLDPAKSLQEQFNLLRVVDNSRYPAYFEHGGHRYQISITAFDENGR